MSAELLDLLPHVDKLNSWVRSKSFCLSWSGRYVIYHYKGEAIKAAARAGIVAYAPVFAIAICRDCNGTRRYTDSWGYKHDHCRRCSSKGHARLEFVETLINGYRWHTPRQNAWDFPGYISDFAKAKETHDWAPLEQGRELELDAALEALMLLEDAFPRPRRRWVGGDWDGDYSDDFATYSVEVGRSDVGVCVVCSSATDRMGWCGATLGRISWSAKVCEPCYEAHSGGAIFARLKAIGPPAALITPTVVRWIETHPEPTPRRTIWAR